MSSFADILTRRQPTIAVYKERCVLNSAALRILGGPVRVVFRTGAPLANGCTRIFIAKFDAPAGIPLQPRGRGARINSTALSRSLANGLQGYGRYRICEEVSFTDAGKTFYEVFFRRYD